MGSQNAWELLVVLRPVGSPAMINENQFCRRTPERDRKCQYANGSFSPVRIAQAKTRIPVAPAGTTVLGIRNVTDP